MIPSVTNALRNPHVIVVANEKGGSGKSTVAIHLAVALIKSGAEVGTIDLDSRQQSLTQYIDNRRRWGERIERDLGIPSHICLEGNPDATEAGARLERRKSLSDAIARLSQTCNYIVIDTPGHDAFMGRAAHALAHTVVTPLNDSFLDLDVFAKVDPDDFTVTEKNHYAEMVEDARLQRRLTSEPSFDWIVLRNRLSTFGTTRNRKLMAAALADLSQSLQFTLVEGLAERMIFREFFPRGLTALDDLDEKTLSTRPTMSHATARLEIENLVTAVLAGGLGRSIETEQRLGSAA
ncbi:MAG: division plane positioning ATPase MipZ [Pseudolabrys sp.]